MLYQYIWYYNMIKWKYIIMLYKNTKKKRRLNWRFVWRLVWRSLFSITEAKKNHILTLVKMHILALGCSNMKSLNIVGWTYCKIKSQISLKIVKLWKFRQVLRFFVMSFGSRFSKVLLVQSPRSDTPSESHEY